MCCGPKKFSARWLQTCLCILIWFWSGLKTFKVHRHICDAGQSSLILWDKEVLIALWLWWHWRVSCNKCTDKLVTRLGFTLCVGTALFGLGRGCGWVVKWKKKKKALGSWQFSEHMMGLAALESGLWSVPTFIYFFFGRVFFGVLTKWWYWLHISKGTFLDTPICM